MIWRSKERQNRLHHNIGVSSSTWIGSKVTWEFIHDYQNYGFFISSMRFVHYDEVCREPLSKCCDFLQTTSWFKRIMPFPSHSSDSCPFVHNPAKAPAKAKPAATAKPAAVAFVVGSAGISGASASNINTANENLKKSAWVDVQVIHCSLGETFRHVFFVSIQLFRFQRTAFRHRGMHPLHHCVLAMVVVSKTSSLSFLKMWVSKILCIACLPFYRTIMHCQPVLRTVMSNKLNGSQTVEQEETYVQKEPL